MDADGDYVPRSVLKGNPRSIVAWAAWKKAKSTATNKGIHRPTLVPTNNGPQLR
jgi:hypothetical protein